MNEFAVNTLLISIMNDESYNGEVRWLAESLLESHCDPNAKIAFIEACIENFKDN